MPTPLARRTLILLLLAIGLADWVHLVRPSSLGLGQLAAALLALVTAIVPSLRKGISRLWDKCNQVLSRRPASTAGFVTLAIAVYFLAYARGTGQLLLQDEHVYAIQARMLAHFHLWLPAYPKDIQPFFDEFWIVTDRVWAPIYFPGTAMALVPAVWLHFQFWIIMALLAAATSGIFYLIVAEIFDPFRALLAVTILLSMQRFRECATQLLSEMPFIFAAMLLVWGWLRLRKSGKIGWAVLIGASAGYAAIVRSMDAVYIAVPIGIEILIQFVRQPKPFSKISGAIILAASPFLVLLAIQNAGITGHWWEFAEIYYNRQELPAEPLGFHSFNNAELPKLESPIKEAARRQAIADFDAHTLSHEMDSWLNGRIPKTTWGNFDNPLLTLLIPVGLVGLGEARRRAMFSTLALFIIAYTCFVFFLPNYVPAILPAYICVILTGWDAIQISWPRQKWIGPSLAIFLAAVSIAALPPLQPVTMIGLDFGQDQRLADQMLGSLPQTPAVVFFRYDARASPAGDDEPMFNDDVEFPDQSEVIRARDRGDAENQKLLDYYSAKGQRRAYYIYDPGLRIAGSSPLIFVAGK
jgi:hypothetical protein